jgi:hypothetical protein
MFANLVNTLDIAQQPLLKLWPLCLLETTTDLRGHISSWIPSVEEPTGAVEATVITTVQPGCFLLHPSYTA